MTFDQALNKLVITATPEDELVEIVIGYDTPQEHDHSASLKTKRYFKDTTGTLETIKRAWEKYTCAHAPERLTSVTSIEVIPARDITKAENKNQRLSA